MSRLLTQLCLALALLCGSALATAQPASASDQAADAASGAATDQEPEQLEDATQVPQSQDAAGQDVAQVQDEEEAAAGRFIPTEQLSQDLGASFPVDI